MGLLLQLFWNICLMREGPERVPTQTGFLASLLVLHLTLTTALSVAFGNTDGTLSLAAQVVNRAVTAALLVWFALYVRELRQRFPATIGALFGTELLITLLLALVLMVMRSMEIDPTIPLRLLQLWYLVIVGFIMHRALNISLGLGIAVALGIQLFSTIVSRASVV